MATRGNSSNIIVGAAQVFVAGDALEYYPAGYGAVTTAGHYFTTSVDTTPKTTPPFASAVKYADTLEAASGVSGTDYQYRNIGYTMNGLELTFTPNFGEVSVDQLLDVAKLYKQGMTVQLKTGFAEATLENLVVAIAAGASDYDDDNADRLLLNILSGELGSCPVERSIIAIGPGTGDCQASGNDAVERVYIAYRALSIEAVTLSAKRDAPTSYDVTFRLLPTANGSYGKIYDRTLKAGSAGSTHLTDS